MIPFFCTNLKKKCINLDFLFIIIPVKYKK